jgi:nicotinate dehydrogenase subunit A
VPTYQVSVNGQMRSVDSPDPDQPLLYVLRNDLDLTGAKFGCGLGQCGACSVLVDGQAQRACQLPISQMQGKTITTLEGLGTPEKPHPVQAAFVTEQAAQCGYCANGMVINTVALLAQQPQPGLDDIKEALANNLCRCGTHDRIIRAVMRASGRVMP